MAQAKRGGLIESGQLVIELCGIAGECSLLAMHVVRDTKAGDKSPAGYERRTKAWRSIVRRVAELDQKLTRDTLRVV